MIYEVVTLPEYPPIPVSNCNWRAYIEGEEDGTGSGHNGWGSTENEAIADLMWQIADDEDFGTYPPLVLDSLFLEIDDYFTFAIIHVGDSHSETEYE